MAQFLCSFACCGIRMEYLVWLLCGGSKKVSKQRREKERFVDSNWVWNFSKKNVMKKYKMKKMPQKIDKKASNQAENGHRQHFQEDTSSISENPVPTTQTRILLTQKINRLIFLYFPIYNLLRSLYQLTHKRICFLSHLRASHYLWW